MPGPPPKPNRADLLAAQTKLIPDVIAPGLRVLFVGINPGLYSAAIGCHFGRPGNRFWPALHDGGLTPRLFSPRDQFELLPLGLGITNMVPRASARADELSGSELLAGGGALLDKVRTYRPRAVAILGITAYRGAFALPRAQLGFQATPLAGAALWILPNPSGLNAHFQRADLARVFGELNAATA